VISAVVFDLDGVLIDSEPVWELVRRELVEERGGRWLPEDHGMRSAAAAGLSLIAIPRPGHPPADDALKSADLVLPSLADLSVAAIESLA